MTDDAPAGPVDGAVVRAVRLAALGLRGGVPTPGGTDGPGAADVVRHLVAVQAQEFWPALWGLATRCAAPGEPAPTAADVVAAFDAGAFLRTHLLRPTWHVAVPDDVRWLLALTGPRVQQGNATMYRREGFTDAVRARAADVLADATRGTALTRAECGEVLAAAGLGFDAIQAGRAAAEAAGELELSTSTSRYAAAAEGSTLTHLLMHAELDQAIVSGPLLGRAQTYAAFDERVPAGYGPLGATFDRDAALRELVRRVVVSRGLVTAKDLATWSGLTVTDVRGTLRALADAGEVESVVGSGVVAGLELWRASSVRDLPPSARDLPPSSRDLPPSSREIEANARDRASDVLSRAHGSTSAAGATVTLDLLQGYDEYVMSYSESRGVVLEGLGDAPGDSTGKALGFEAKGAFTHGVAVDGVVVGRWKVTVGTKDLTVETQWYRPPSAAVRAALDAEVGRMAAHRGVTVRR